MALSDNTALSNFHATPRPLITAIETNWNGYHFRSRAEARWAVCFTKLGIQFEYEPEGYVLPNGTRYLPDFWLPQIDTWAEVKGMAPTTPEMVKAEQLAVGAGHLVLFLDGPPDFRAYVGVSNRDGIGPIWAQYSLDIDEHKRVYFTRERRLFSEPDEITEATCTDRYREAVRASRAERFEVRP